MDDLGQNMKELNDKIETFEGWIRDEENKPEKDQKKEQIKEWREQIKEWREDKKSLRKQVDAFTAALEEDTRRRVGDLRLEARLLGMLFCLV